MIYASGEVVQIGDTVHLGGDQDGTVVAIISEGQYADGYEKADWAYLASGLVISTTFGELRLDGPDQDLELVSRLAPEFQLSR